MPTDVLFYIGPIPVYSLFITSWVLMALLVILFHQATKNMQTVPHGLQNVMETIIEALFNFLSSILGEVRTKRYLPLLATFFLFIICANYSGMLPGAGLLPGIQAPTSDWNVNAGLALIVFLSIHYFGFRVHGLGYLSHFVKPMWFLLPMNIIEEFARPLSLTLRLFGNVFGEEAIVAVLLSMAPFIIPVPMLLLGLLTGGIQAVVFTILATTYIAGSTEVESH